MRGLLCSLLSSGFQNYGDSAITLCEMIDHIGGNVIEIADNADSTRFLPNRNFSLANLDRLGGCDRFLLRKFGVRIDQKVESKWSSKPNKGG